MPNLFIIAGPNGAGKSTSAPELLSGPRTVAEFVNADVIQKEGGMSEIAAGRVTLARLEALAEARRDMAFETMLASHLLLPRIRRMQSAGYQFHLFFFWLRRYERGLDNFFNQYLGVADTWVLMNNTSRPSGRIASRSVGGPLLVKDNALWHTLSARYMKPRIEEEPVSAHPSPAWTAQDIEDAVNRAVAAALKRHKARGESVVIWRDGKVVELRPEEIDV